jgi:hypothetical protein
MASTWDRENELTLPSCHTCKGERVGTLSDAEAILHVEESRKIIGRCMSEELVDKAIHLMQMLLAVLVKRLQKMDVTQDWEHVAMYTAELRQAFDKPRASSF